MIKHLTLQEHFRLLWNEQQWTLIWTCCKVDWGWLMQVALNSEGVLKAVRDRGASKWESHRSLHLFPCSQFNDCYQHYPALGLSIETAKLRGGSSPHYTQAAAWCATHHRVAHTSCLPAKTTGLFFEPYPARSPCSPWLHLTMMPSKRRSVSKPSWSLCWLATLTLHLSTLASLDVFLWPFDMFWLGMQRDAMSLFHAQLSRPGSWK